MTKEEKINLIAALALALNSLSINGEESRRFKIYLMHKIRSVSESM